jgi:hypothetical protein
MSDSDYIIGINPATGETIKVPVIIMADGSVQMAGNEMKLATANLVDLNNAATPALYTVPAGKSCIITRICERNASTSLTTNSLSIGWTSAAYNDVVANATHTGLTGPTLAAWLTMIATGIKIGTSGQALCLKNNTLQGGAATASFDIYGLLF